ncbi:hypothetical protein Ahy_B06g080655 [Arachis hypogaea]|uniref:Uncharacterized protein n=1 Tax=Arachis hypogaea TaxID=3818 RepID=A0A444YIR7_ARAHY|nr:hypothetical protein Ahy_B06g080655 [Arachis hypogaea]
MCVDMHVAGLGLKKSQSFGSLVCDSNSIGVQPFSNSIEKYFKVHIFLSYTVSASVQVWVKWGERRQFIAQNKLGMTSCHKVVGDISALRRTYKVSICREYMPIKQFPELFQNAADLPQTFPGHPWLDTPEGHAALRRVLVVYSLCDSNVGCCQVDLICSSFLF